MGAALATQAPNLASDSPPSRSRQPGGRIRGTSVVPYAMHFCLVSKLMTPTPRLLNPSGCPIFGRYNKNGMERFRLADTCSATTSRAPGELTLPVLEVLNRCCFAPDVLRDPSCPTARPPAGTAVVRQPARTVRRTWSSATGITGAIPILTPQPQPRETPKRWRLFGASKAQKRKIVSRARRYLPGGRQL